MWFIGLGLGDESDVTVKGQRAITAASRVYLEAYTSVLGGQLDKERLVRRPPPRPTAPATRP